jgi:hypothetical protein
MEVGSEIETEAHASNMAVDLLLLEGIKIEIEAEIHEIIDKEMREHLNLEQTINNQTDLCKSNTLAPIDSQMHLLFQ